MIGDLRWKQQLVIRLNSDLCVATGDGYSSSVDIDVCSDAYGFPFIPSRRLKGCLREAAVLLGYEGSDEFENLFGVSGSSVGGSLRISDAAMIGAGEVVGSLLDVADANDPRKVLDLFTYTRAQTAIDANGTADDNTLRFVRVVKQYGPVDDGGRPEPLQFASSISCDEDDGQKELLKVCCRALRNIGYGRNRGLGAVSCTLADLDHGFQGSARSVKDLIKQGMNRFEYTVRLDGPLMLPQQSGSKSLDYIPGTMVLGFFARQLGKSTDFDQLFLEGKVRFSPLYPVEEGVRCCPAPPFIVKVKGGNRDGALCSAWQVAEGETVKPFKDGYVAKQMKFVRPETEIVYHHSVNVAEKTLYTQRCLKAGQMFSGFVEGDPELILIIATALIDAAEGEISFGRSKTAQYSRCSLVGLGSAKRRNPISVRKGERYAFLLDSDVLISRGGAYTTSFVDLKEAIRESLGDASRIFECADVELPSEIKFGTSLRRRVITGYNAKWNHKKPHVRALSAGSSIVFEAASDFPEMPREFLVGDRQAEGFGRVLLVEIGDDGNPKIPFDIAPTQLIGGETFDKFECDGHKSIEELRCATIEYAESKKRVFGGEAFGRAFISRLARMVEESSDSQSFSNRVESIKADSKRENAMRLIAGLKSKLNIEDEWSKEKECLDLLFTLGKYYAKQNELPVDVIEQEGALDER